MIVRPEKKNIPILMYHSISEYAQPKFKRFAVPPALFAEHMAYLHHNAYTPITVTQFVHARSQEKNALPERPVVLTFDDGFADFFSEALPVLRRYDFTATVYIPTAYIGGTSCWLQREGEGARPIMTRHQLSEVSANGIECSAHSHSHPQLDILPPAKANDEIIQSKRLLEDYLGREVTSFAYPHGYHTTAIKRLVREAGYTSACAVKYAMSSETTDPFALARLLVGPATNVNALAALLIGQDVQISTALYKKPLAPVWRFVRFCGASTRSIYTKD